MKKLIFTLTLLTLINAAYTQISLKNLIKSEGGISKSATTLSDAEQVTFDPQKAAVMFGLNPSSDLKIQKAEPDNLGYTHYRYYQTYKEIPVENSMYIVHVKAGKLLSMNGEIVTEFDAGMEARNTATINAKQAVSTIINYLKATKYAWQDEEMENALKAQKADQKATYYPSANLVWFSNVDEIRPRNLRLAYKTDVYTIVPLSRAYYFIDAQTGKVLGKKDLIHHVDAIGTANTAYSGAQTIHSDLNAGSYRLRDLTKGSGVKTLHGETGRVGTDYTSTSANWTLPGTDIAALDAHFGVSKTYEFYKVNFNRDSYDNYGSALTSYVNDDHYTDNAYWDGIAMYFCKRSNGTPGGVTSIDVTGHELTHAFTQSTSDLVYSNESGAMNESMSDIMGKSVQFWAKPNDINWKLGNSMNWIIRDMANPNAYQQPDTYNGTYWYSNADVHINSGVGNFMFYLLVTGGSGTNDKGNAYSVSGIGLTKADQIIYRTNNMYLTPTAKYADWRTACIRAATDLYGAYSNETVQVQNAWYAVGVGAKPVVCTSVVTPANLTATNVTTTAATLNWSSTGANSYNLQWKTSTATTFTTVTGIVNNSYNLTGLTAGTSYQFKVQSVCGTALSAYSPLSALTTPLSSITYCASNGDTKYEYINRVTLRTISNTSGNNNGYGNFTNLSTTLTTGTVNTIFLYPGYSGTAYVEYWTVFIDYNKDGDFADAGETVTTGSGSGAVTTTFTVPSTAKNGATRMRIQMKYNASTPSNPSCAILSNGGEVEDYTVSISGGTTLTPFAMADEIKIPGIKISPNPVTEAGATVTYTIAKAGNVTLRIVDMTGRLVSTISGGTQTKGTYTIPLNNKEKLPAGNYIIAVQQGNDIVTRTSFIISK